MIFAKLVCKAYHTGRGRKIVGDLPTGHPLAMMTPSFGQLLLHDALASRDEEEILFDAYLLHQYKFDRIVNAGKAPPGKTKLEKYAKLARDGDIMTKEAKLELLVDVEIVEKMDQDSFRLIPAVRVVLEEAAKAYLKLWPDEDALRTVVD